jgi:hypothetical protein
MAIRSKLFTFLFWQQWLFFSSLLFAFAGIIFAIFGKTFIFLPYDKMLAQVFWNANQSPKQVEPFQAFIYAPLGGTIACAYILLAFIAYYPFKQKQTWARNAIITAFSFWVVADSGACIYFKVYPQIYIINAFSIAVKALPILCTWHHFPNKNSITY